MWIDSWLLSDRESHVCPTRDQGRHRGLPGALAMLNFAVCQGGKKTRANHKRLRFDEDEQGEGNATSTTR